MKRIFYAIINIVEKKFQKKILILSNRTDKYSHQCAVMSDTGYWYVGDIFDRSDIAHGIASNGYVEKEESELVTKVMTFFLQNQAETTLYDVGANTGYYGILSAFMGKGKIKVYSFEPMKEYVETLRTSVALNRLDNLVSVYPYALGAKDGNVEIFVSGSGSTIIEGFSKGASGETRSITIKRMDALVVEEKILNPDFIKIDVEGAELGVLQGGRNVLLKTKPVVFVEIISPYGNNVDAYQAQNSREVLDYLKDVLGYEVYCLDGNSLAEVDEGGVPGVKMYLCVDNNKHKTLKAHLEI